jgi:hypothetical protein|tara:strand:+ start:6912 stop:7172 length:261 start_codon:yes stop_codon:yes gene_type:complete
MSDNKVLYTLDGDQYSVNSFSDEAKLAFACLVDANREVNSLLKKKTILQAASVSLSQKINEQLTDGMLVNAGDSNTTKEPDTLTDP